MEANWGVFDSSRTTDVRFVGSINGCYTLSSRRHLSSKPNGVEVFACRFLSISPTSATVAAPVSGLVNERLTARIDGIGIVAGNITRLIHDGFVFSIDMTDAEREVLAKRLRWLKRRRAHIEQDRREHPRFLPHEARTSLTLPDGRTLKAVLIDISRSGAALSADIMPEVGDAMIVGRLPSRVVRLLEVGFAVQFDEIQPTEELEKNLASLKVAPSVSIDP